MAPAACANSKEGPDNHARKFSNHESESHNAKNCCDAPSDKAFLIDDSLPCDPLKAVSRLFTPFNNQTLRYNCRHVDRSAFRTFGEVVAQADRLVAVPLAPRTVVVELLFTHAADFDPGFSGRHEPDFVEPEPARTAAAWTGR